MTSRRVVDMLASVLQKPSSAANRMSTEQSDKQAAVAIHRGEMFVQSAPEIAADLLQKRSTACVLKATGSNLSRPVILTLSEITAFRDNEEKSLASSNKLRDGVRVSAFVKGEP